MPNEPVNPGMPAPEPSGFVRTLNGMGYMTSTLDAVSQQFVDFVAQAPGPALDVGAAYGVATLAALKQGRVVYANDLSAQHLVILESRVPPDEKDRLRLVPGEFPEGISFQSGSLGAVLIARVLHFFPGDRIERALQTARQWLAPGGKLFVVTETPYLRNFQKFIPLYEARKSRGELWPGLVTNVAEIAPERAAYLPPLLHFLDPEVLTRVALQTGFDVERCVYLARRDFPEDLQWDGRESVGLVAVKR